MANRWVELTSTSPSGKALFVCQSCGRKSDVPERECYEPAMFKGDTEVYVPCAVWPMRPDDWLRIQREQSAQHIVFSGTLTFEDGRIIQVTAPIHEALAKDITVISTEIKMRETREAEALRGVQNDDRVQELKEVQVRVSNLQEMLRNQFGVTREQTVRALGGGLSGAAARESFGSARDRHLGHAQRSVGSIQYEKKESDPNV